MADIECITASNGDILWYLNGVLHSIDAPAVEWADGSREWWLNGRCYAFKIWLDLTPLDDEQKLLLKLQYGCHTKPLRL